MQMMETNNKAGYRSQTHATKQKNALLLSAHNSGRRRCPRLLTKDKGNLSTTEVLIRLLQLWEAGVQFGALESFVDDREQQDVFDLVHPVEIASVVVRPGFQDRKIATFAGELKKRKNQS